MAPDALSFARSEIYGLLLRAARGAGIPEGHSEDFAAALSAHGTTEALSAASRALRAGWSLPVFEERDGGLHFPNAQAFAALPTALDALRAGVIEVVLYNLDEPKLLGPYLAHVGGFQAHASGETWILGVGNPPQLDHADRVDLPEGLIQCLNEFAAKTYVPATQASRAGAGAGAIDND
ncbi:MAG: hypothetical protein AAGF13_06725 [Pseudomonadota bacterium]